MDKVNKILIIGDSSMAPRKETPYEDIYPTLLKKMYINSFVESFSKRGMTSKYIFHKLDALMFYGYTPNIVILNYGIVDSYPRPYPNCIHRLLVCSGVLNYTDKFLKKITLYYKLGDFFNFKEVPLEKFESYSEKIIEELLDKGVEKIILIGIIKPDKVLLKSNKVDIDIQLYNQVYKNLSYKYKGVIYLDMYTESKEDFTIWDGYHYTKKASMYIVKKITKYIHND